MVKGEREIVTRVDTCLPNSGETAFIMGSLTQSTMRKLWYGYRNDSWRHLFP